MTKASLLALVVVLVLPAPALSAYESNEGGAAATASQQLTLRILPAIEASVLSSERNPSSESTKWLIGIRSNVNWSLTYQGSSKLISDPICMADKNAGPSNLSDAFQTVEARCQQEISWSDDPGISVMTFEISAIPILP